MGLKNKYYLGCLISDHDEYEKDYVLRVFYKNVIPSYRKMINYKCKEKFNKYIQRV